ncbi:glycosyltransferase family 2 protein [uncultured Paludibaculum sp.]|uniref:glycosyltransferase family 2 protein n=1 Tax=uncultured Paludibaculum sp. TaxID=1765020 RepID=UPI00374D8869
MGISVLILTLNEERNIESCLRAVSWSDDVVVLDSFSSDRTVEIARAYGARVVQRRFDNENAHRSASLKVGFRNEWVFNPDADEICSSELYREMAAFVECCGSDIDGARMRRKDMFMGTWLRYSSLYPTWHMRLFRPERLTFERHINMRYVVPGGEGRLSEHLLHYSFNNGIAAWIDKHNKYSTAEAIETRRSRRNITRSIRGAMSRDPLLRRAALKEMSQHVPMRVLLRFLYCYVWRRGFLDGRAGFVYCQLIAMYEMMIVIKVREEERRSRGDGM